MKIRHSLALSASALALSLALSPPLRAQTTPDNAAKAATTQQGATQPPLKPSGPPASSQPGAQVDPALFSAMQWRSIGPFRGGRALAAAGVPSVPGLFYFGAAAGGVWKTVDYGATWKPIFDGQSNPSIGAIAVAASNPNVIYVGTGEGALRGDITYGDGVFKSTDAGKTWSHIGLEDTRQIGALIVDPKNPNIVLVAAICSGTKTPARSTSPSIPPTARSSTRHSGRSAASPGISTPAAPAVACSAPPMAA
jgi:hypothetical protein